MPLRGRRRTSSFSRARRAISAYARFTISKSYSYVMGCSFGGVRHQCPSPRGWRAIRIVLRHGLWDGGLVCAHLIENEDAHGFAGEPLQGRDRGRTTTDWALGVVGQSL